MKTILNIILLITIVLCSCQKNRYSNSQTFETKSFFATIDDETKTSVDKDGNVLWKKGNQVSVFDGNTKNRQYQVTDESDGKTSATLTSVSEYSSSSVSINNNVAFYPYNSSIKLKQNESDYTLKQLAIPYIQYYEKGSFGNGVFPMVAVTTSTTDMSLKFKNIMGGIKIQLKGDASIAYVKIKGNNKEILCGQAEVVASVENVPSITLSNVYETSVILDCGTGVKLNTESATSFVIALPPILLSKGFTVTILDTEGKEMEIKTENPVKINRSQIIRMSEKNYVGTQPPVVVADAVDLGLPSGTLWAEFNIGANKPSDFGDYFAWGETKTKACYEWSNYSYCSDNEGRQLIKYVTDETYGTIDNKTTLESSDDAASQNWGGNWRTPTHEEWMELCTECTWEWTSEDGINGYKVSGNNNSIFLPAAGYRGSNLVSAGEQGDYWSSSLNSSYTRCGYYTFFKNGYMSIEDEWTNRCYGNTIRPVCK